MKHIRKDQKYICGISNKEYSHPRNLKLHMIKLHEIDDLKKKNIDPELVLAEPIKKPKMRNRMTDLEEKKRE
jgi:hypothetical protein